MELNIKELQSLFEDSFKKGYVKGGEGFVEILLATMRLSGLKKVDESIIKVALESFKKVNEVFT